MEGVPGIDPRRLVEATATAGLGRGDQLDRAWPSVARPPSNRLGEIYAPRLLIGEGVTQSTPSPGQYWTAVFVQTSSAYMTD